jgi:hypothetical protein
MIEIGGNLMMTLIGLGLCYVWAKYVEGGE